MVSKHFHSPLGNKTKRRLEGAKVIILFHHTSTSTKEICRRSRRYFWQQINLLWWTWSWGDISSFWGWAVRIILAKHNNDSSIFIFFWLLSPLKRALFLKVLVCFRSEIGLAARRSSKSEKLSLSMPSIAKDLHAAVFWKHFHFILHELLMQQQRKYVLADCLHSSMIDLRFCGSHSKHNANKTTLSTLLTTSAAFKMSVFRSVNHGMVIWPMRWTPFHRVVLFQYLASSFIQIFILNYYHVLFCCGLSWQRARFNATDFSSSPRDILFLRKNKYFDFVPSVISNLFRQWQMNFIRKLFSSAVL